MPGSKSNLLILSGTSNPELAKEVADYLELTVAPVKISPFSDGEIYVQVQESVRGQDCFVVQPTCTPVNENLMELLILLDALKRASAGRITVVTLLRLRQTRQKGCWSRGHHCQIDR